MKKGYLFLAGLILLGIIYSFANGENPQKTAFNPSEVYKHAVVIYAMNDKDIQVCYGGDKIEEIRAQKESGVQNAVIDVFDKLGEEGFSLKSTISLPTPGSMTVKIVCYFEKEK